MNDHLSVLHERATHQSWCMELWLLSHRLTGWLWFVCVLTARARDGISSTSELNVVWRDRSHPSWVSAGFLLGRAPQEGGIGCYLSLNCLSLSLLSVGQRSKEIFTRCWFFDSGLVSSWNHEANKSYFIIKDTVCNILLQWYKTDWQVQSQGLIFWTYSIK